MTAAAATALIVLASLDGAFAGFRSAAGRTGLIRHRTADRRAACRGAGLVCVLLAPVTALVIADVAAHPARTGVYTRAGEAMLAVYGPYAAVVLAALGCYAVLGWRQRYLASALILGPLTLLRPAVAAAGAVAAAAVTRDAAASACAGLAVVAVLAVEPAASRRWYAPRPSR